MTNTIDNQSHLILAAEDCPPEYFSDYHSFSKSDQRFITKLIAHGPVLLRGGRGSGKSALMIEASRQLGPHKPDASAFGVYLSLRHLELLRSQDKAYEKLLCTLLIERIQENLQGYPAQFDADPSVLSVRNELTRLTTILGKRVVIFFDDAAHIGREASLDIFFDILRTLSSSTVSCKAAIYPGVTKFGTRFDVYNDATILNISRNEELPGFVELFKEIMTKRYPEFNGSVFSRGLNQELMAGFLGQAVVGNMRAFIFLCNELSNRVVEGSRIGLDTLGETLISLSSNYYWPLLEELKPKLGVYEVMIDPALEIAEIIFKDCGQKGARRSVLVHRDIIHKLAKPFEMLEYAGFIARRDVSRAMKSGGRGTRFSINLCNLLEETPGSRLTRDLFERWKSRNQKHVEFHRESKLSRIQLPELQEVKELAILNEPVQKLEKSPAYPYGLTNLKREVLLGAGIKTVRDLAEASDETLLSLRSIGGRSLERVRNVVAQAVWM